MAKIIPANIQTDSDKRNRGDDVSRLNDKVRNVSVGLLEIDSALFYYFENVIKPVVKVAGEQIKVPVIYANSERWKSIQKDGYLRDVKQKIITPAIAFRRTSFAKDDRMPVDKLNPSEPVLHEAFQSTYTSENRYDNFSATRGIIPKKEMFTVAVPDYIVLSYDFIIWTNFTDQQNSIVEKINWSEGSYWGEPGRFKFRAVIDSFEDASEYDEAQRNIKTNFSVTLSGYLVPEHFDKMVTTQKYISKKTITVGDVVTNQAL
jgi:hypothetical protein